MLTNQDIENIKEKIVKKFNPQKLYLFGSYAYGNPTEESDLDIAVIDERSDDAMNDIALKISMDLFPRDYSLEIITISPEKLSERKFLSFWGDILNKGRLLYERK